MHPPFLFIHYCTRNAGKCTLLTLETDISHRRHTIYFTGDRTQLSEGGKQETVKQLSVYMSGIFLHILF